MVHSGFWLASRALLCACEFALNACRAVSLKQAGSARSPAPYQRSRRLDVTRKMWQERRVEFEFLWAS